VVAFVVAALTFALAGVVVHPSSPKLALTSGTGTAVTSEIFDSPACSGAPANLVPRNHTLPRLHRAQQPHVPVTVQSITMSSTGVSRLSLRAALIPTLDFRPLRAHWSCPGKPAPTVPELPITMLDSGTNQDNCQNTTLHFVYSSVGQFTDSTTTSLSVLAQPSRRRPTSRLHDHRHCREPQRRYHQPDRRGQFLLMLQYGLHRPRADRNENGRDQWARHIHHDPQCGWPIL